MDIQLNDFLSFCTTSNGGMDLLSIKQYKSKFIIFKTWLIKNKLSLSKQTIERFFYEYKEKGLKGTTLNGYAAFFKKLEKYCLDRELDSTFFKDIPKFKKSKSLIQPLSVKEIEKIIDVTIPYRLNGKDISPHLNLVYKTFYVWLIQSGCRLTESILLQVKDIDIENRSAYIPPEKTKTETGHRVNLFEPLFSTLKKIIQDKNPNDYVFTSTKGTKFLARNVQRDLIRRAKIAGIQKRVYPHVFRHSLATGMAEEGVDLGIIASILNHSNIQTTYANYVHFADKPKKNALQQHPYIRKHLNPQEKLKLFIEYIKKFGLDKDKDFAIRINEGTNSFSLDTFIK